MHILTILRGLGILLMVFSLTLIPPILVSVLYADHNYFAFCSSFLLTLSTGILLWLPLRNVRHDLRTRDGFFITTLFWIVLGLFGALPFLLSSDLNLSVTDAVFESMSGLTTTGSTIIVGLDSLSRSILYYRQQLQWLGGLSIIVIAVAILPMLGIGGMQLYRGEAPGAVKDSKLSPRIADTAKILFVIYVCLTTCCAFSYWLAGMSGFDAICHAFSTVSIGGFSTHDQSMGYFNSPAILMVSIIFMGISAVSFALHFFSWRARSPLYYFKDPELQFYFLWLVIAAAITIPYLFFANIYSATDSFLLGTFQLTSIITTTGFHATSFSAWPAFLPFMLFLLSFIGGCAGSTAGGMKAIRVLLICKQCMRDIHRLIHPNATFPVKVGKRSVNNEVIEAVWGFFAVYILAFLAMFLILLGTGLDLTTSFSAVTAALNNLGLGMGDVAANYAHINTPAKWTLCLAMLLGRLEVFTLLVFFSPIFWRR